MSRARDLILEYPGRFAAAVLGLAYLGLFIYSLTQPDPGEPPPYPDWHVDVPGV